METMWSIQKYPPPWRNRRRNYGTTAQAAIGPWSSYNVTNKQAITCSGSRTVGQNLPNWKELIRSGGNATTSLVGMSYDFTYKKTGRVAVRYPFQYNGSKCEYEEDGPNSVVPGAITLPLMDRFGPDLAISYEAFLRKARNQLTSFEGLTFLGELREAVHMIHRPLVGIRGLFEQYRRKTLKLNKKTQKNLANLWLELSFGWQPLAGDVSDGLEALSHLSSRSLFRYLKTKREADYQISRTRWTTTSGNVIKEIASENRYKATLLHRGVVRRSEAGYGGAAEAFGLTLPEFIPTAWELIPYSFLVDYFSNVGEVVGSAGLILSGRLSWASRTVVIEAKTIMTESFLSVGDGGVLLENEAAICETTRKQVIRTPEIPVTLPPLRYSGLSELTGNVRKELNLLALLMGKF